MWSFLNYLKMSENIEILQEEPNTNYGGFIKTSPFGEAIGTFVNLI